jgi:hypothetical protein
MGAHARKGQYNSSTVPYLQSLTPMAGKRSHAGLAAEPYRGAGGSTAAISLTTSSILREITAGEAWGASISRLDWHCGVGALQTHGQRSAWWAFCRFAWACVAHERADEGRRADADVGAMPMPMPMLMDGLAVGVSGIGKSMYMVVVWDCE